MALQLGIHDFPAVDSRLQVWIHTSPLVNPPVSNYGSRPLQAWIHLSSHGFTHLQLWIHTFQTMDPPLFISGSGDGDVFFWEDMSLLSSQPFSSDLWDDPMAVFFFGLLDVPTVGEDVGAAWLWGEELLVCSFPAPLPDFLCLRICLWIGNVVGNIP